MPSGNQKKERKQRSKPLYLVGLLFLIGQLLCSYSSFGQIDDRLFLTRPVDSVISLIPYTYYWMDSDNRLGPNQVMARIKDASENSLSTLEIPSRFERGRYAYWFYFQIHNASHDTLQPIFTFARFDSIHLYQKTEDWTLIQTYGRFLASDSHLASLPFPDKSAVKLVLPPGQKGSYLLRFRTTPGWNQNLQPALMSPLAFLKPKGKPLLWFYLFNGCFLGILLFMSAFTMIQFIQSGDQAFLFFGLFLLSLFMFFWRDFELTDSWLNILPLWFQYNVMYVPIKLLQYASYVLFIDRFLNAKVNHVHLHRFTKWVLGCILVFFFLERILWYQDIWLSWKWYTGFRYLFYGVSIYYLFWLIRKPVLLGRYIIWGTLILMFSVLMTMLISILPDYVIGWWDLSNVPSTIGILVQIGFYSLGLGKKRILAEQSQSILEQQLALKAQEALHLQQIDQVKTSFFTNLTHELRTPLSVILGMAEKVAPPFRQAIQRNSNQLLDLINQMLELARLEAGKSSVNWIQADIVLFLKQLISPYEYLAQIKNRQFSYEFGVKSLQMDIDPKKLERVLTNLLMNALKFTPENGHIQFQMRQVGLELQLSVKDNGKGIAPAHLPHIFDRFYQADQGADRFQEGTGLGLALARQLVEQMGGKIEVHSQLNIGATFRVLLPIHQEASIQKANSSGLIRKQVAYGTQATTIPDLPSSEAQSQKSKLLLIEDHPDLRAYLQSLLSESYHLLLAENVREAKELALNEAPDLILSDIMLPDGDGLALCQFLKNHPASQDIPIILISAKSRPEEREAGLKAGADAYLSKPFRREELYIRIQQLLDQRKSMRNQLLQKHLLGEIETQKTVDQVFLQKVSSAIEQGMNQPQFGVDQLATAVGLSRSQLNRRLRTLQAASPAILIKQARLKKAQVLLQESDLSINEVAFRVGFKDPSYFSRQYQKQFGKKPSDINK